MYRTGTKGLQSLVPFWYDSRVIDSQRWKTMKRAGIAQQQSAVVPPSARSPVTSPAPRSISARRKRELASRYRLPRHVEPAGWALLDQLDRQYEAKKKARLAALHARGAR
jgi:hypothetical protein